jgi:hypothetical protein
MDATVITLTAEQAELAERCREAGGFDRVEDAVAAGLQRLADDQAELEAQRQKVNEMIEEGVRSMKERPLVDGRQLMKRLDEKYAGLAAEQVERRAS